MRARPVEFLLILFARADIREQAEKADNGARVVAQRRTGDARPQYSSIGASETKIKRFIVTGKFELELTPGFRQVLREDEFKAGSSGHRCAVSSQHGGEMLITKCR